MPTRPLFYLLFAALLWGSLTHPPVALAQSPEVEIADLLEREVSVVYVVGNHRIEPTTIRGAMLTREGSALRLSRIQEDVEAIFALGFFRDVIVDAEADGPERVQLTVQVQELPVLESISFDGNRKLLEETLKEAAGGLVPGSLLTPDAVARAAAKIRTQYAEKGYLRATVVPVQEVTEDSASGDKVVVSMVIDEGQKTKIREVLFSGNEAFSDRTLRRKIKTKDRFWLTSWLTDSGILKADQVEEDQLRIESYYQDRGYPEVKVSGTHVETSDDKRWQTLTFVVDEGRLFTFGEVTVNHSNKVEDDLLSRGLSVKTGQRFSRARLRADQALITDRLGEHGYAFSQVNPIPSVEDPNPVMDVVYQVDEGLQVKIRRINISGNEKTVDKVIRREVRQQEGEIINTALLRRSFQRINNLNYFESVDIVPEEAGPGLLDLDIRVKEKSTGQFSIGGGFSSVDGLVGLAEVTFGNFMGRGQTVSGRFERSGRRTSYNLRFREPHVLDTDYTAGFDVFNTTRDFESYEEVRTGAGVSVGKAIGEFMNSSLSYRFETVDIRVKDVATAPAIITDQDGTSTTSSVTFSLSRDTRDNFLDPRKGFRNQLSVETAGGALGGSNAFVKGTLNSSAHIPLPFGSALAFRNLVGAGIGLNGESLPPGERFFVGGINTVRGFGFGEAGLLAANGDPVGGTKEWVMSAEIGFPLVKAAKLKGALFVDWGASYPSKLSFNRRHMNLTWGYEIRWISPLGPLRLGFGWVIKDRRPEVFRTNGEQLFTIGTFF